MPPATDFKVNETVLAFHGPLLYRANVLKREQHHNIQIYLLHYVGFDKHWDEWAPASRIRRNDAKNQKMQLQRLRQFHTFAKKQRAAQAQQQQPTQVQQDNDDKPMEFMLRTQVQKQLHIPISLKTRIISDWESITRERKLFKLPRQPNVATLLADFLQSKSSKRSSQGRVSLEVCDGLNSYFNTCLPLILLCKFERRQLDEITQQHRGSQLTEIYGAEHFLRLLLKLPELLCHAKLRREQFLILISKVAVLIQFIAKNREKYLAGEMYQPSVEYLEWFARE